MYKWERLRRMGRMKKRMMMVTTMVILGTSGDGGGVERDGEEADSRG
jgi:hypothetical protein